MNPRRPARHPSTRRRLAVVVSLICALALVFTGFGFAGTMLVVSRPLARVDAVISLASHEWERLPLAARIASEHPHAIVLLTEPQPVTEFNCHDCAHRVDRLERLGIAPSRVRVVKVTSPGTHGEALAALAFAREEGIGHFVIATSPYHTRRSLATFQQVFEHTGIEIGVEPATISSQARPAIWWLQPDDRAYVPYEWAAIVYYAWHYGVWAVHTPDLRRQAYDSGRIVLSFREAPGAAVR